jgi:hypothetical protein
MENWCTHLSTYPIALFYFFLVYVFLLHWNKDLFVIWSYTLCVFGFNFCVLILVLVFLVLDLDLDLFFHHMSSWFLCLWQFEQIIIRFMFILMINKVWLFQIRCGLPFFFKTMIIFSKSCGLPTFWNNS